jgi:putative restriction endonuclease
MTMPAPTPSFEINGNLFGEVPGVPVGMRFTGRQALHDARVHRGLMRGIAPMGASIVLSGGYEDDEDHGDTILYTGEGGRDANTGRQTADQLLTLGNLALAQSMERGWPVRVIRGHQHDATIRTGYRYDGLYRVASYWSERGPHGHLIWRFRMERISEPSSPAIQAGVSEPASGSHEPLRAQTMVSRIIRNTRVGDQVKEIHDYRCQVCSTRLETPAGPYAESCHIRPLGRPHNGPDTLANVLCLCPNCHVLLDDLAIWIDDDRMVQPYGKRLRVDPRHCIDVMHAQYQRALCDKR